MKTLAVLTVAFAATVLTGCQYGTAGQGIDAQGSICANGWCITAPAVRQSAPVIADRETYDRAVQTRGTIVYQ